jgi:hypothetical protein
MISRLSYSKFFEIIIADSPSKHPSFHSILNRGDFVLVLEGPKVFLPSWGMQHYMVVNPSGTVGFIRYFPTDAPILEPLE